MRESKDGNEIAQQYKPNMSYIEEEMHTRGGEAFDTFDKRGDQRAGSNASSIRTLQKFGNTGKTSVK
jgi:hypothetical protein